MMLQCGWTLGWQALILLALWHCAPHVTSGMCRRDSVSIKMSVHPPLHACCCGVEALSEHGGKSVRLY